MSDEPGFVHTLSSGVEPLDDELLTPHRLEIDALNDQMREMEDARAAALVSGRDYMIHT